LIFDFGIVDEARRDFDCSSSSGRRLENGGTNGILMDHVVFIIQLSKNKVNNIALHFFIIAISSVFVNHTVFKKCVDIQRYYYNQCPL